LAAFLCVVTLAPIPTSAQIPSVPTQSPFEVASVRGFSSAPADPAGAFGEGVSGPRFAGSTHGVVARFVAATPPVENELSVVWIADSRKGAPRVLAREPVARGALAEGVHSVLTNAGNALAPGDYQVSIVGASGRIYRTVEFEVVPPPRRPPARPAAAAPAPSTEAAPEARPESAPTTTIDPRRGSSARLPYTVGGVALEYPATYSAIELRDARDSGTVFVDDQSGAFIFVSVRTSGQYSFQREADQMRSVLQRRTRSIRRAGGWRATALRESSLPSGAMAGRMFVASTDKLKLQLVMYSFDVDGRSVISGYAVVTPAGRNATPAPGLAERIIADFYALAQSLRGAAAAPAKTERPRLPRESIRRDEVAFGR
jgi:hypothetical protein